MFKKFYGLSMAPFSKGIPSSDLFRMDSQEEAITRLEYVANNRLFGTLTGEVGSGKTTVLRRLRDSLDEKVFEFLYVADSMLTPRHFYNGLLSQLGKDGAFYRGDCRRLLHQEIELISGVRKRKLVIVVDEAHLLSKEMLEELRFLLNFNMDSECPLALVLAGQPELEIKLDRRDSLAIKQRIDFRCRLQALGVEETGEYIRHHLRHAGAKDEIFDEKAVDEIFAFSMGLARLINRACVSCLVYGSSKGAKKINGDMVKGIIEYELR
jgi:type II secretory pathway predicted ATPase ExeA